MRGLGLGVGRRPALSKSLSYTESEREGGFEIEEIDDSSRLAD